MIEMTSIDFQQKLIQKITADILIERNIETPMLSHLPFFLREGYARYLFLLNEKKICKDCGQRLVTSDFGYYCDNPQCKNYDIEYLA
jgi:hypothetical protein